MIKQYRKKPVVIEAMQFNGTWDNAHELTMWIGLDNGGISVDGDLKYLTIPTLEGDHRADVGDFIIKGVAGEFYPCKPDIFKATYDEV